MKTIDCITFFNEPLLFDLRLNILDRYVDEFIVCEAKYTMLEEKRNLISISIDLKTSKIR